MMISIEKSEARPMLSHPLKPRISLRFCIRFKFIALSRLTVESQAISSPLPKCLK